MLLYEAVEKAMFVGGALASLAVGNLCGFWNGVLCAGTLLFAVSFVVFVTALRGMP